MNSFLPNNEILEILDPDLSIEDFSYKSINYLKKILNHNKIGFFEYDNILNSLKLLSYGEIKVNKSVYKKLILSLNYETHPYYQSLKKNEIYIINNSSENEKYKYLKIYRHITDTEYHILFPILYKEKYMGLISVDFSTLDDLNKFKERIDDLKYNIQIFSHLIYCIQEKKLISDKYEKYKNLHESSLTVNKLYMDKYQEILKMTLLAVSGIIEANLYILLSYHIKKNKMTLSKLYKHGSELDLNQITLTDQELKESLFLMECTEPKIFSFRDINFSGKVGFHGREIIVLPKFEMQDNINIFMLGRNSLKLFSDDEINIIRAFSEVVKITIDNSYLYHRMANQERLEKEVEIASDIQMNLLPREIPEFERFEFGGFMIPAREIGGDYYDFLPSPDGKEVTFAIGDVSGKGVPAGMVMATARTIIHSVIRRQITLMEIIDDLNAYLYYNYKNSVILRFMSLTLFKLIQDDNRIEFAGGGHGNILVYRKKTDSVEIIPTGGMVLGISVEVPDSPGEIFIEEGDILLVYTDGATECSNSRGESYEEERLIESFMRNHHLNSKQLLTCIYEDLSKFVGNASPHDDITFVTMKRLK